MKVTFKFHPHPQEYLERELICSYFGVNSEVNWSCPGKFIRCFNTLHFLVDKYRGITAFSGRFSLFSVHSYFEPTITITVFKAGGVLLKLITRANDSE